MVPATTSRHRQRVEDALHVLSWPGDGSDRDLDRLCPIIAAHARPERAEWVMVGEDCRVWALVFENGTVTPCDVTITPKAAEGDSAAAVTRSLLPAGEARQAGERTLISEVRIHKSEIVTRLEGLLEVLRDGEILANAGYSWTGDIVEWSAEPVAVESDHLVVALNVVYLQNEAAGVGSAISKLQAVAVRRESGSPGPSI